MIKNIQTHIRSIMVALRKIMLAPFDHIFNIFVVALIILFSYVLMFISYSFSNWQNNHKIYPKVTIYLDAYATQSDVLKVQAYLNSLHGKTVSSYTFIDKHLAIENIKKNNDLNKITREILDEEHGEKLFNILPNVFEVYINTIDKQKIEDFAVHFKNLMFVTDIDIDYQYLTKIFNMINFVKIIVYLIEILMMIFLAIIFYNLVRLQIMINIKEIIASRLIGASDWFIIRPFVYYSVFQTLISILLAIAVFYLVCLPKINLMLVNLNALTNMNWIIEQNSMHYIYLISFFIIAFTIFSTFCAVKFILKNNKYDYTQ